MALPQGKQSELPASGGGSNKSSLWQAAGKFSKCSIPSVLMTLTSSGLTVNGSVLSSSDRNVKEDFEPVDSLALLAKVVAMPLSQWRHKSDEERSRHLGPMAQDFKAAFNLGADDKHIAIVDAHGVALAAILGLNQKLEKENADVRARLERLEKLLAERP